MTRQLLVALCAAVLPAAALVGCGGASVSAPEAETVAAEVAEHAVNVTETWDRSQPPPPGTPRPFALPAVSDVHLSNGMHIVLVDREGFPTVAARMSVYAGRTSAVLEPGLPDLTATLLRDGTSEADASAIAARIGESGIAFDTRVERDVVTLSADGLSTKLDTILELLSQLSRDAQFPDDRFIARRDELAGEIELAAARPSFHLSRRAAAVLFGDHPYAIVGPSVPEVQRVTVEQVRAFYRSTYAPNRSTLVLVGDLPDDIAERVESAFGGWTSEASAWQPAPSAAIETCNDAHVVVRPDSAQTSIAWVGPGVALESADYFPTLLANQVLGGGASARLFMNLREDKSFTYGAYSTNQTARSAAVFRATSDVRNDVTEPAVAEFLAEFAQLGEPIPPNELQDATDYLAGVFPIQLQTNGQLAARLAWMERMDLDRDWLTGYRSAVTGADPAAVDAAGAHIASRDRLSLVMVGEEDQVIPAATQHTSRVFVYDLEGALVRELDGELASSCDSSTEQRDGTEPPE